MLNLGGGVDDIAGLLGDGDLGALLGGGGADITALSESLVASFGAASTGAAGAGAALAGIATVADLLLIGVVAVALALKALEPAIEGTKILFEAAKKSAGRYENSRAEGIKTAKERMLADVRTMVEEPFTILKNASQALYDAWDNNIRVINATQGYNKDDLSSLIGKFADRLRSENLTSVVSAADITDNLTEVLKSGLSGTVAEEFAYIATVLNAAVPTQDFFTYADTYASLAANAVRNGKSEADAIEYANSQLEGFASDVLYASRELAGGFSTGLKDASSIFAQSVQMAQAGKSTNVTGIAGVMTAVSAITGAIAPDLATSMTDAIYKAATGGNSSEVVALRSLAGINASNTEFLKQLTQDPQKVFANLFTELAKRQNMSQDSYMEVAEGLSSIFGVSTDAFARVDFNYLAQAITAMSTTNGALSDNLKHLASGETTTNAEQLKMQQVNEYMLDEGLSYVLDNEAARAVQEHMWDEQLNRQLLEATYGVELQGAALEFLEGIRKTVDNVLGFLNPLHFLGKIAQIAGTAVEVKAQEADVRQLLELGKVGSGNSEAMYQLLTRNTNVHATDSLLSLMGGASLYRGVDTARSSFYGMTSPWNYSFEAMDGNKIGNSIYSAFSAGISGKASSINSAYKWDTIGKSVSAAILDTKSGGHAVPGISQLVESMSNKSKTAEAQQAANGNLQKMLDTMSTFVEKGKSYDDWFATSAKYGIADMSAALEKAELSESQLRSQFDTYSTKVAAEKETERKKNEEAFWDGSIELLTTTTTWLEKLYDKQSEFYDAWVDYYVNHTAYSKSYDHNAVSAIQRAEKDSSADAIYTLADALTKNNVDLLDPAVQTNAFLAEILKVVNSIMTQNNSPSQISLPDTIAGMSLGVQITR